MHGREGEAVARQFTSFVGERTRRPTGCRGRYNYNSSQELPGTQDTDFDFDGMENVHGSSQEIPTGNTDKDGDDHMENADDDTVHVVASEVRDGVPHGKAPLFGTSSGGGDASAAVNDEGDLPTKRGTAPEDAA